MPEVILSDASIKALKPKAKQYEVPVAKVANLWLRVYPLAKRNLKGKGDVETFRRAWFYRFSIDGKSSRIKLGEYPALDLKGAGQAARERALQVDTKTNPVEKRREAVAATKAKKLEAKAARADLVELVAGRYYHEHLAAQDTAGKPHCRAHREIDRVIRKDIVAPWRGRRLSEISRADIKARLAEIKGRGAPILANRVLNSLAAMSR